MSDRDDGIIARLGFDATKLHGSCLTMKLARALENTFFVKFTLKNLSGFVTLSTGSLAPGSKVSALIRENGSWAGIWNKAGNQPHQIPPSADPDFIWLRKGPPVAGVNPPPGFEIYEGRGSEKFFSGEAGKWDTFPVCWVGTDPNKLTFPIEPEDA